MLSYNMNPEALEQKLKKARQSGRLPKIVVPVHMCSQSCDMKAIHALSQEYGFSIIEDASHAIGGKYKSEPVGSCRWSDITVFSFHPVKLITTGEGGMAVTNNPALAERMSLLRSHGIMRNSEVRIQRLHDLSQASSPGPPAWHYEQIDLGFNYRMTDIQAALGLSQLSRLDEFVSRRKKLAQRYDQLLQGLPLSTPWQHPDSDSAWHIYVIRLKLDEIDFSHREVFEYMGNQGIGVNVHYIPVHTQPYYQNMGFDWGIFPKAEKYYQEALTLPLFPAMSEADQDRVVDALKRILPTPVKRQRV